MNQTVTGPDYGTNYGTELGIPGINGPTDRYSGLPTYIGQPRLRPSAATPNWMPLFRTEKNWTFSTAVTKVLPKHELRVGFDFVRLELNHYQAEFGDYGGCKGGFSFNGTTITGDARLRRRSSGTSSATSCSGCRTTTRRTSRRSR